MKKGGHKMGYNEMLRGSYAFVSDLMTISHIAFILMYVWNTSVVLDLRAVLYRGSYQHLIKRLNIYFGGLKYFLSLKEMANLYNAVFVMLRMFIHQKGTLSLENFIRFLVAYWSISNWNLNPLTSSWFTKIVAYI